MLKKITELGSVQATATENVARKVADFLQYAATYPVTKVTYHASDMTLHTHSDASYLGETADVQGLPVSIFSVSNTASAQYPPHRSTAVSSFAAVYLMS